MRVAARVALCVATTGCFSSAGLAQASGQAAPAPKPRNPLEIPAPAAADEKGYKAFQKFQAMPESDAPKKIQAAEDFLGKFGSSLYATYAYSYLTVAYVQTGQIDKGLAAGEKDLQINPSDFRTMAVMAQTISRTVNDSAPDAAAKLGKAQELAKNAEVGVATWAKPDSMPETNFTALKNDVLSMAHGTLGLVAIHKNNFEGAIPDLQKAVEEGTNTDPTNYYLLGIANQNSGHYQDAAAAFEKCAAVKGTNLTATCVGLQDQAKQDAAKAKR